MKINEVIQEGILDTVKSFIPGTSANTVRKSSNQQATTSKNVAKQLLQQWSKVQANIKASGQEPSPEQVAQWFGNFAGTPVSTVPANMSPATINQWLTTEISRYMANKALGAKPTETPAPTAKTTTTTNTPQQRTQSMSTPAGVQIVSPEPLVLRFKNKDFVRGDQGQWVDFGTQKSVPATVAAFLDKQEDILHPATPQPTKTAPVKPAQTAPVQPAPKTPATTAPEQPAAVQPTQPADTEMPAVFTSNRRQPAQPAQPEAPPSLTDLIKQRQSKGMTE